MEIVATAMKEFATNQDLEADVSLEDKIIKSNTNIPMILVDENGNIGANSYLNLDPVKAKDPAFLLKQLEIMKEQNSPIEINFAKNRTQYIYYRNSDLLIDIWKDKIHPKFKKGKLLITPNDNKHLNFNIFERKMESQRKLVEDLLKSKVFLVPGHKAELYCLAAEEARELCIPIVTMGIGSLYERVEHGKTGFIAKNENEFASYTLELFNNETLWNQMRSNLIKIRGKSNWSDSTNNLLKIIS